MAQADTDAVVTLSNVRQTYQLGGGVEALAGVPLSLLKGSYTAVMGPSGSGKRTLLTLVGGLDTPTEGRITVDRQDPTAATEAKRADIRGNRVGFALQTFKLMSRLAARENVANLLVFCNWGPDGRNERAHGYLADVGLGDRLEHKPTELNGGQRQRVTIARALATGPELILADEPTGNGDTEMGDQIMGLLGDLYRDGHTILLVSHERQIAERAECIVHVRDGRIDRTEELTA